MLYRLSPLQLMVIGFVLLVIGFILPFLMVLRILEPALLLGFIAYLSSLLGLVLGVIGIVMFGGAHRHHKD